MTSSKNFLYSIGPLSDFFLKTIYLYNIYILPIYLKNIKSKSKIFFYLNFFQKSSLFLYKSCFLQFHFKSAKIYISQVGLKFYNIKSLCIIFLVLYFFIFSIPLLWTIRPCFKNEFNNPWQPFFHLRNPNKWTFFWYESRLWNLII